MARSASTGTITAGHLESCGTFQSMLKETSVKVDKAKVILKLFAYVKDCLHKWLRWHRRGHLS